MKKNKWLTLLSLLLGVSTVLGACGGDNSSSSISSSSNDSSSDSSTDAAPVVEASFTNFINTEYKADWKDMSSDVTTLNDEYGTCVNKYKGLYLFAKEDKNFLSEIVQTWTLYNAKTNSVVWTKEHTFEDGDYYGEDKYGNAKHAPVEVSVSLWPLNHPSVSPFAYVQVVTKTYERYSDEVLEQMNETLGEVPTSYKEKQTTEYYSADGKLIASTKMKNSTSPSYADKMDNGNIQASFGKTMAEFDKDGNLVSTWNRETDIKRVYFAETEKYGYTYTLRGGAIVLDVYNKAENAVVYSKAVKGDIFGMMKTPVNLLENGDMFVQDKTATETVKYDYLEGGVKYNLTTTRIDVETGKETEVEFNYVINQMIDKEDWEEEHKELGFTENVYNVAWATKVEDGALTNEVLLFFDNALNVQYEWAPLIPEQVNLTEIDVLDSGDLLLSLASPVKDSNGETVDRAIVTVDGELVCYVPKDAVVMMDYIVPYNTDDEYGYNVYDFYGEQVDYIGLGSWTYTDSAWEIKKSGRIGDKYIFAAERINTDTQETETQQKVVEKAGYFSGGGISTQTENYGRVVTITTNYMVTEKDGQYSLYDGDLDYILTTNHPIVKDSTIVEYDDCFVVEALYGSEVVVYVIEFEDHYNSDDNEKPDYEYDSSSSNKGGDEE